jgi:predicted Zn finger-like uncharacterized protein
MSLITSCPACGTMFRVVPDQLKISEGWVRCGHCAQVFDATAHLAEESVLGPADGPLLRDAGPPSVPEESIRGWEATAGTPLSSPSGPATLPGEVSFPPTDPAPAAPPPPPPLPPPPPSISRFGPDSQSPLDAPFVFRRSDLMDDEDALPSVLPPAPDPQDSRLAALEEDLAEEPEPLPQVSFVRQARRKAFWRRPLVRLALFFVLLALAAVLALQVAYHDRDRLAAAQPALRPVLAQMCGYLRCTLGHPRQIEALVVDSSGFNRLRGDSYRLSFSVRNTAPVRVAAPALELTLTDSQDQPLVRRVLSPQELGAVDGFIPAGSDWAGTAGIVVSSSNASRVAGYRLLAFYP